jgi:cytidylate kinase
MAAHLHEDPKLAAAIERQMQNWSLLREIQDRAGRRLRVEQPAGAALRYVTISRETGAGGGEIARLVSARLGWQVFDKNLLDQVAERFHESRLMLDLVDETPSNWAYDVFGAWMDHRLITHQRYMTHLSRVIQSLARHGGGVFVGRGAQFLLPSAQTLAVRVVAPKRLRIERIMKLKSVAAGAARKFVEETDRGRADFIQRFFRQDIGDPRLYDLVVNVEHFGLAGAADVIVAALLQQAASDSAKVPPASRAPLGVLHS